MSKYPRLTEMGVLHPQHITRYSVSSVNNTDYLVISYVRPKNSLLPVSRTYAFNRIQTDTTTDEFSGKDQFILETDPAFREAEKELQDLVEKRATRQGVAESLGDELNHLEEEFAAHIASLRSLVDGLKDD